MRITPQVLDEAIAESAGEEVLPLVKILKRKNNVSEFKLAEKIKKEVNVTRNLLYRLYNINLVSFERIKDKKKGWYVYYWSFRDNKVKDLVITQKKHKLERLKERLKKEESNKFYSCEEKCLRLNFEQAFDFEFKCPECGQLLNEEDNFQKIKKLKEAIQKLEKELKSKQIIVVKEKRKKEPVKKKPAKKKKILKKKEKKKPMRKKKVKKKTMKKKKKVTKKKAVKKKKPAKKTLKKKKVQKKKIMIKKSKKKILKKKK